MTSRQVGNYQLDHLLGVGGMGEVYHAYDSHRDRYVALKLLPEAFSGDKDYCGDSSENRTSRRVCGNRM